MAARQIRQLGKIDSLFDVEFCVFSQWGEDGIIEWLVHHLNGIPEVFVEFGVENYRESNTRFLLQHRNWRGLVIDGSDSNVAEILRDRISWRHDLRAVSSFVTRENINSVIRSEGFEGEIGILSIDIDGMDYWVWEAIATVDPLILIVEYNSAFGDLLPLTVPYKDDFSRNQVHYSNLYYGMSIQAARYLAVNRGYRFVGTNRAGSNAFFVRSDRAGEILNLIENVNDRPSRFRESRAVDQTLSFVAPVNRAFSLADLSVIDVSTNVEMVLRDCDDLYSDRWLALLGCQSGYTK